MAVDAATAGIASQTCAPRSATALSNTTVTAFIRNLPTADIVLPELLIRDCGSALKRTISDFCSNLGNNSACLSRTNSFSETYLLVPGVLWS